MSAWARCFGASNRRFGASNLAPVLFLAAYSVYSASNWFGTIFRPTPLSVDCHERNATPAAARKEAAPAPARVPLPPPNASAPPVSFGACCGLGHRLSRNVPTMVYAISRRRPLRARWPDVEWNVLFNDTSHVTQGPAAEEHYDNDVPRGWRDSPLARYESVPPQAGGTPYERFVEDAEVYGTGHPYLFEMPLGHSVARMLADSLSPLVLSFLEPVRRQRAELHLCAHVREGNNETGDWEGKTWRHIDLRSVLDVTLASMREFAEGANAASVSVFAASDTNRTRPYLEKHVPRGWHVVKPGRAVPHPDHGVWFGEHGSKTGDVLSAEGKEEAMAEAVADVFALGECHALFIPNYSSFSTTGIMLTRAGGRSVFFLRRGEGGGEYVAYP